MPQRAWIISGCTVAALLIVAAAGYYWLGKDRGSEPSPETAMATPSTTPKVEPSTLPPQQNLEQMLKSLQQEAAKASGRGEPVETTLTVTEEQANSEIAPRLLETEIPEELPVELEAVHFDFQPEAVLTELAVTAYGITVSADITAQVNIVDGKPEIEVTDIGFGWMPLPEAAKDQLTDLITTKMADLQEDALDREMAAVIGDADWSITYLSIQEEQATVTLLIQPETTE